MPPSAQDHGIVLASALVSQLQSQPQAYPRHLPREVSPRGAFRQRRLAWQVLVIQEQEQEVQAPQEQAWSRVWARLQLGLQERFLEPEVWLVVILAPQVFAAREGLHESSSPQELADFGVPLRARAPGVRSGAHFFFFGSKGTSPSNPSSSWRRSTNKSMLTNGSS